MLKHLFCTVLLALCLPALAADAWVVKDPLPRIYIPGKPVETWPPDYNPPKVGSPCDCQKISVQEDKKVFCPLPQREVTFVECKKK